jgi:hypothetical protein
MTRQRPRWLHPKTTVVIVIVFLWCANSLCAQGSLGSRAEIKIVRVKERPRLADFAAAMDAGRDPAVSMARVEGLVDRFPRDGEPVSERTIVYLGYDSKNIYAVWMCFDRTPEQIRARLVRRDGLPNDDDSVALQLDTFHDRKHAYGFLVYSPCCRPTNRRAVDRQGWPLRTRRLVD